MGFLTGRWIELREHQWREWAEAHEWSDLGEAVPALAVAAGWPRSGTERLVAAAEGEVDGREVALALVRYEYEGGEGNWDGSVVWAELRRAAPQHVVTVSPRLYQRRVRRRPITDNGFFDGRFKVRPKHAAPELPRGLLAAMPRLELSAQVVLAPESIQLTRPKWLSPPALDRLLGDVVALAGAADGEQPSKPRRDLPARPLPS